MTLIAVYGSEGCIGRCDARCYLARDTDCDCVCGGRNHGAGKQRAMENTAACAAQWVREVEARTGVKVAGFELGVAAGQMRLEGM